MLNLNGEPFAPNAARYYEEDPSLESGQTSIHVQIVIPGDIEIATLARLDPATPWVVLNGELTRTLGLGANGPDAQLQTAAGRMKGTLEKDTRSCLLRKKDNLWKLTLPSSSAANGKEGISWGTPDFLKEFDSP